MQTVKIQPKILATNPNVQALIDAALVLSRNGQYYAALKTIGITENWSGTPADARCVRTALETIHNAPRNEH